MATIQSLNPIYLSGNLPNFVVQSAADQVTVVVKLNGSEILNEVYNPVNGGFVIKLKYLLCSLLYATIPPADVDAIVQDKSLGTIQILITDGIAAVDESFLVLKGGVETDPDVDVFLVTNFLTWQPQVKKIQYADPEFLTYCSLQACRVKVKAYFSDDTDQTITFWTLAANDVYTFNLAYARLVGKFSAQPVYFDVWTEDLTGDRLSYIQRYIYIEPFTLYNDVFVFENTLGGIDTVHFLGEIQESNDFNIGSALFDETTLEYDIDISIVFNKKTGYVEKESDRYWWLEFFKSIQRYHISEGALKRIFVTKPKLDSIPGAPNGYEFSFAYAFQTKYISLPRLDTLPSSVDITDPTGELFFLAPRLAQFPWISVADNPLILVQLPYSDTWGVTSVQKLFENFNTQSFTAPSFSNVPDGDITDNIVLVLSPSGAVKKKTLGSMAWADASDFETGATARGKYLTGFDTSLPGMFTVNASPSGPSSRSLNVSLTSQLRNTVLAGPMGSTGVPSFRALVVADIPSGLPYAPDTTVSFPGFGTSHILAAYGDHNHSGVYEVQLGNPSVSGYLLSSTTAGVRSWAAPYTHPTNHAPSIITQDASNRFVTDTQIGIWNGTVSFPGFGTSHILAAYGDHNHSGVYEVQLGNPSVNGYLLSSTTAGVRSWVAPYTHPTNHAPSIITQDTSNRFVTDTQIGVWNGKVSFPGFGTDHITASYGDHTHSYLSAETDTLATVTGRGTSTGAQITVDSVIANNNGNGTNFRVGDDVWIGDINSPNTFRVTGFQDATAGYIVFGNSNATALGRTGTGALTYGGNTIYHSANLPTYPTLSSLGAFATPTGLTTNQLIKWNGSALVNSLISDDGSNVFINTGNIKFGTNDAGIFMKRADGYIGQAFYLDNSNYLNIGYGVADRIRFGTYLNQEAMRIYASGDISMYSTTESTSSTTGALVVSGGIGVNGNVCVGDHLEFFGYGGRTFIHQADAISLNISQLISSSWTTVLEINTGVATFSSQVQVNGRIRSYTTSDSNNVLINSDNNYNYGVLIATGNGTSTGDVYSLGYAASSGTVGTSVLKWRSTGQVEIPSTTASTTSTTGALIVGGGIGVGGNIVLSNTKLFRAYDNEGVCAAGFGYDSSNLGHVDFSGRNLRIDAGYNATISIYNGAPGYNSGTVIIPWGYVTIGILAGSGTRMVVADSAGTLSTQSIPSGGGGGTVVSVGVSSSNGFAGTSSGGTNPTLTLSTTVSGLLLGNGTSVSAVTNNSGAWNTAYGWGNHASAGYVTGTPWTSLGYITSSGSCSYASTAGSASANDVYSWAKASTKPSYSWSEIGSHPTALSQFSNDLGNYGSWITGFTETDPLSLHLTGGTLTGALYGTTATFSGLATSSNFGLSDIRYKNSILPISTQHQFNGEYKQYYMNDDKTHTLRFGIPAQDLQKYLPNLVSENPKDKRLMVNYTDLYALEIHNLKKEVRLLKEQLRQFLRN